MEAKVNDCGCDCDDCLAERRKSYKKNAIIVAIIVAIPLIAAILALVPISG